MTYSSNCTKPGCGHAGPDIQDRIPIEESGVRRFELGAVNNAENGYEKRR
jgi:hypothetical protein